MGGRWAAPALAALLLAAGCTGGSSDGTAATTGSTSTTVPRPEPGTRLDAAELPPPVSNLEVLGDLVTYLTPGEEADLELVAVDPSEAEVAWRHDAALSLSSGDTLDVVGLEGVVAFVRRSSGESRYALDGAEADGSIRWSIPIGRPTGFPYRCEPRLCVETIDGPVRVDPVSGDHDTGRTVEEIVGKPLSVETEPSLQRVGHTAASGGEEILSAPRFGAHPLWTVRLLELLGTDDATWEAAGAVRHGDLWAVGVYRALPDDAEEGAGPYEPGDLVALSVDDGSLLWRREDVEGCVLAGAEDQLLACTSTQAPATQEDSGYRVTGVAALDRATGADRLRVDLVPYDPVVGGAYAVTGPDRMLMVTTTGVQEVDLAAATAEPAAPGQVGWCRRRGELPKVQGPGDEPYEVYSQAFGRPCALDGTELDEAATLAPIVSGDLPPVDAVSSVAVGPWVLWNDEGTLAGVATS